MLLHCWLQYNQTGNPSYLTGLAPGGAGTTQNTATAPSEYAPMVGYPTQEPIAIEFLDNAVNGVTGSAPVAQGGYVAVQPGATNGAGGSQFAFSQAYGHRAPLGQYAIVNKVSGISTTDIDEPGGEGLGITNGPIQALCTTGANAIAAGTLLCADGNGNLTSFNNPSAAPTATLTVVGTTGSTAYTYGLVAASRDGTYSAVGTASTSGASNATLTNANYNQLTWTPVADAAYYIVVRLTSAGTPSTVGVIGKVLAETAVFNDTGLAILPNTSATQFFQRLAAPSAPTVTTGGTGGSTNYAYKVTAIAPNGVWSAESTSTQTTAGNATLSATNKITITGTNVTGAVLYAVDRSQAAGTPSTTGLIGYCPSLTTGFVDIGYAAVTFPTAVTTPEVVPQPGRVAAVAAGTLAASTTTPTLVSVLVGTF